jgi:branched-chain amino acid transport system substrate-binding protein
MRILLLAVSFVALATAQAGAQDSVKIGLIAPLTGQFTLVGQEMQGSARVYLQQHGNVFGARKIELIIRDDGGVPDASKRIAQELIVRDKVNFLAGMGLTPIALAIAPLATEAKIPLLVTGAATSTVPAASPLIVRTSFSVPQNISVAGDYFAKQGIKSVFTLVSDYAPGIETETVFKRTFEAAGGKVVDAIRAPLANPDFSPFLQRAADARPEALFIFVPSGQGATLMRQFKDRALDKSGIRLLTTGDVLDDAQLDQIGDVALGVVSVYQYSDAHPSELNGKFTSDLEKLAGIRAAAFGVGTYDGMALIQKTLEKTAAMDGETLIDAMKGLAWESPRGPISIDPQTRDIVQNVYIRRVEKRASRFENVEFATYPNVRGSWK